jgi:hypothetical protein
MQARGCKQQWICKRMMAGAAAAACFGDVKGTVRPFSKPWRGVQLIAILSQKCCGNAFEGM